MPASASSLTLHSQGTVCGTMRTTGIPLFDEADRPSVTKPSFASTTAGRCKSSTDIASCTRNFVHDPQSATESTTASTPLTHTSNRALPSVRISGGLIFVDVYQLVSTDGTCSLSRVSTAVRVSAAARLPLENRPIFLPARYFGRGVMPRSGTGSTSAQGLRTSKFAPPRVVSTF